MIDVDHQINAVRRSVGGRVLEAGEARVVTVSQTYHATVEDVWDACTNPRRLPRWFLPISGDLRPGGRYQFEGNAGGMIERCDPPHGLDATWEMNGQVSWVELRLHAEPQGRTRFVLEHIAHVDDNLWDQFGPGAVGIGWDLGLMGLATHLAEPDAAVDPAKETDWPGSAEGRRFVGLSSDRWADASAAAGTDPAAAKAAAERTTAFYTPAQ